MYKLVQMESEDDETEKKCCYMTKGYLHHIQARENMFEEEIQILRYENDVLKAQVHQYCTKSRKLKRLVHAAINQDNTLYKTANSNI